MIRRTLLAAAVLCLAAVGAGAQQYPAKTVRIVLPFPTGPGIVLGPLLAEKMRDAFQQGVATEVRAGAGGSIAMELVARAAPDGYTLLIVSPILTHTPLTRPGLKLDPLRDFAPISNIGAIANLMAVHPSIPVKSTAELIRIARARPGMLTYGSSGHGGTFHLVTELFSREARIRMRHVPYKSVTFAVVDLVRGDVDMVIGTKTSMTQFFGTGKLRLIAVLSAKRLADLPEVPTMAEQGMPELVVENYYGLVAPGGTPPEVIERLHREVARIGKLPDFRKAMARIDFDPVLNTPAEFGEFVKKDHAKWARVVREAKIRLD
ncbi:MAG: tripartite tricarboxylate transporter substrate binding protein [Burkholderiales bacterium]|nr:tripartite tricarboxylate transporter substrate binding protein [Burkholderiales bacterium]